MNHRNISPGVHLLEHAPGSVIQAPILVKADIDAQAPDISGRDNAALAVAATQITAAFAQLHDRGLIPDDELVRLVYTFAGETVDVDDILSRAPRTPQVDFNQPGQTGKDKPGRPAPNNPKPYNLNPDSGDVSIKGATQDA